MSAELSQQLSTWLDATDITTLELRGPGVELRLLNHSTQSTHATTTTVSAPSVGVFLHTHPLRDAPLAAPGQTVFAGQVIALLQVGTLLTPVIASHDGTVATLRVAHGTVVGYGTALLDINRASAHGAADGH